MDLRGRRLSARAECAPGVSRLICQEEAMKRIAMTLGISAFVVGALVMPALVGGQPALSLAQKPQDPRTAAVQPAPGLGQAPTTPETWRGEHRRHDWDRPYGEPTARYGWRDKPPSPYWHPKWGYRAPVYVPSQWVWDGHMWVLTPAYWAY
jgi:hypothetical protein